MDSEAKCVVSVIGIIIVAILIVIISVTHYYTVTNNNFIKSGYEQTTVQGYNGWVWQKGDEAKK